MGREYRGGDGPRGDVLRWALVIPALVAVASCRTPSFLCVKPSGLRKINIIAAPIANEGRLALEGEVLFVTDKRALNVIAGLKAADYFAQRKQLANDYPGALRGYPFGLEAGQHKLFDVDPPCNLAGTLLFVNYDNDKPNRIRLTKAKSGTLTLDETLPNWQRR